MVLFMNDHSTNQTKSSVLNTHNWIPKNEIPPQPWTSRSGRVSTSPASSCRFYDPQTEYFLTSEDSEHHQRHLAPRLFW